MAADISHLKTIEQRLLWLSHWMIHNANHNRDKEDGIKVGGHQASSASIVSIMTALYFSALRPEDRVAVKPHASPIFHAMQYLMGNQTLEKMQNFRGFGGVQSYPSRTKDIDDVDFSTGSVGLGVAITAFASLVQDYIAAKEWGQDQQMGRMVALVGDAELAELMENLGGNCVGTMAAAFDAIDHGRPVCFLAYTVKGWGTPIAGHKDNHGGLMNKTQMAAWQKHMGVAEGAEWEKFATVDDGPALQAFLDNTAFFAKGRRRYNDDKIDVPEIVLNPDRNISTQMGFGKILDDLSKGDSKLAERIVTTSPDVTGTTNLGPWVNRRKLFAREVQEDIFRKENIPSTAKWDFAPQGQHIELGIAEMNLFLLLGAAGLSHSVFGKRLLPIGTVYDPFISRGLDALNYACYQDARFMIVGTPSGITLAPEGGAHQSIGTPLIGMSQDGLAAFEPAYVDELAVIMQWAFN